MVRLLKTYVGEVYSLSEHVAWLRHQYDCHQSGHKLLLTSDRSLWRRNPQPLLQYTRKVRRPRPVPQQEPLSLADVIVARPDPRIRLCLALDAEGIQDLDAGVVCRAMCVAHIALERRELLAPARDGVHRRQGERLEVRVELVNGLASRWVTGDGRRDELGGDFLRGRCKLGEAWVRRGASIPYHLERPQGPIPELIIGTRSPYETRFLNVPASANPCCQ
jgi:hypothetical protein